VRSLGIEVKAVVRWTSDFGRALRDLVESRVIQRGFGIDLGGAELKAGPVRVLPLRSFLGALGGGRIFD
jgi:hypothetical protein